MRVLTFLMPDFADALGEPRLLANGWYYQVEDQPAVGPWTTQTQAAEVGIRHAKMEKQRIHGLVQVPLPIVSS